MRSIFVILLIFSSISLMHAQTAEFNANFTTGCDSRVIQFTDASTGSPTAWVWDFGDGSATSSSQNPSHFYASPGVYTVSLTASIGASSDTETKTNYITIFEGPTAAFSQATSTCVGYEVSYTDLSTPGQTAITDWLWDFGDGNTSTLQNPTHSYQNPGTYNVTLFITDGNNCTSEEFKSNVITVAASPTASFTASNTLGCSAPLTVTFTDNSSGTGLDYAWNFGNGNIATTSTPIAQTYNSFGVFLAQLVVTSSNGCTDTARQNIYNEFYTADFSSDVTTVCIGETINFSDESTIGSSAWNWNFGDGNTATAENPTHSYSAPGTYDVTLESFNNIGCDATTTKVGYITVRTPPSIVFSANDTSACQVPFAVNFSDASPNSVSWAWDFGDGNTSNSQNPSNTYLAVGNYDVSLTITDANNCDNTLTKSSYVNIIEPIAQINANRVDGCIPLTVNFSDNSFSNETITDWLWDFGDGSPTSTQENPTHIYTDTGSYTVTLIIQNVEGCIDTVIAPNFIQSGQPPVVDFNPKSSVGCHPFTVNFVDASSSFTDQWEWDFGDGNTSGDEDPTNTFRDTGFFDVELTASFHGCSDVFAVDSAVEVLLPIADFTSVEFVGCQAPHLVTFVDSSHGADSWLWRFGDGTTSTLQSPPAHNYPTEGFYEVTLVVENFTTLCRDSITRTVGISAVNPGFSVDTTVACAQVGINFTDTSNANNPIVNWRWEFGDGNISNAQNPTYAYAASGFYDVKLVTTDSLGCEDSTTISNLIEVKPLPAVNFTASDTFDCAPLTTLFTDATISTNTAVSWDWDFGDGNGDTLQNTAHDYTFSGTYSVVLSVTDTFGCIDSLVREDYITTTKPFSNFTSASVICNNTDVTFVNSSVGAGLSYVWDFGDGSAPETSEHPVHSFSTTSDTTLTFDVSLTTTDSNGCDSTIVKPLIVSIPQANFFTDSINSDCPPLNVNFTDSSSNDVVSWSWDVGDGGNLITVQNPSYTYNFADIYTVALYVTNNFGCTDSLIRDSLITIRGPKGSFTTSTSPNTCFRELTFFSDTEDASSVSWIFGDGDSDLGDTVVHTYPAGGTYNPIMVIVDTSGCQVNIPPDSAVVIDQPLISASFITDSLSVFTNDPITFTDLSSADFPIVEWVWVYGDGTIDTNDNNVDVSHFYTNVGDYLPKLIITDSIGCKDSIDVAINIKEGLNLNTTFSPNNDGINDLFVIKHSGMREFSIQIFDRWGGIIFETTAPSISWDGRTTSGAAVPPGTYFYVIEATSENDISFDTKGFITLFR